MILRSSADIPEEEDYKMLSIFTQTNAYFAKISSEILFCTIEHKSVA